MPNALNEANPGNPDILKYLNLVRERAGIPQYGSEEGMIAAPANQDDMRDAIRRERRVEFNCEYAIRFDDIRRWKQISLLRGNFDGMNKYGTDKSADPNNKKAYYKRRCEIIRAFSEKTTGSPSIRTSSTRTPTLRQLPKW